tara:strand:+ start:71 stop:1006 length:936 start_codon:yes stop_codon:yes gene_type:complete
MALTSSGQISLNDVNVELGNSGTAQIGLGDTAVRNLFEISSGEIEMADGYGKSSQILPTQTYTSDSNSFQDVAANNGGTVYTRSLTFSGWTPQAGDLVVAVGWAYAHAGQQPSTNMTTIYHAYGGVWDNAGYGFKPSYAISYRICNGNESNTIDVVRGGAHQSVRTNIGGTLIGGHSIMSGAVFRYSDAITGVSTRNVDNTFPIEPNGTTNSVTRVLNNSSISQPYIDVCDNGNHGSVPAANRPTNYFSNMTNAFEVDRGSGTSNGNGSTCFRPSNGNENITWTSYPHGGTGGAGNEVKCGRFSSTLLLSF